MGLNTFEVKTLQRYKRAIEAISSSKIEGADDMGLLGLAKKVDKGEIGPMDWLFELKTKMPALYETIIES
ncbi:hypothetical protein FGF1_03230 [Flavobacteriaceae bacterium GF1]